MTCRDVIEFLGDYLDGRLPAEEQQMFDAHLAACSACVAYLESYRRTVALGREALAAEPGAGDDIPEQLVAAILAARCREQDSA